MSLRSLIMEITGITVPLVYEPPRTGDVRDSLADIRRAQEAFGYAPEYTVKTGLKETIAWYIGSDNTICPLFFAQCAREYYSINR